MSSVKDVEVRRQLSIPGRGTVFDLFSYDESLQKGSIIRLDGALWEVLEVELARPLLKGAKPTRMSVVVKKVQ